MSVTSGTRVLMSTRANPFALLLTLTGENPSLRERAGPLWRSSLDERDVGPHRVISMSRPGLFACFHRG